MDTNSRPVPFEMITENVYLNDTTSSRDKKRAKKMVCECQFDPEMDDPETACGEDCLNRLLLIECSSRCPCGEYCTNKRFQRAEYAKVEVFKTEMKGWGLRALIDLPKDMFVMEYCGEVCSLAEFEERKKVYSMEKRRHYYFMSLKADDILDATHCGNMSRFINHSCDPNCETQKWTVEGRLRIGFFTLRHISAGEELTFDYQFQRFGEATAQRCYCGAANCRGYLGVGKPSNRHQQQSSPRSSSASPLHRKEKKRKDEVYVNLLDPDALFEKQVYDIVGSSWRLMNSNQVLAISRAMIHAETSEQRNVLLKVLQATEDEACLKKFLSLQGLRLLWSWMVDSCDMTGKQQLDFRMSLLTTLKHLPIATKNQIEDNKLLMVVQKWLQEAQQAGSVPRKTPKTTISKKNVDITVTEADSVQCPPTSCDESQHEEVKPDTNSMTIPPSSTRENKENSGIKAEEKLTQKDDSTSQELVDPIQSKNNVSLKNDDQKETQEEGIKDNVKTEAVECDKLTVEDVKDIVNDTVTKDSHIDIKESPEDDNNMNKETVVAQKEEAEVGSMKEIVATEQELTEGDIVKQAENDEDNKLEQIITEQRDTHHSEEDITQKVGEDLKGLEEHMQMEQVEKDMNTSQSEGDVMTQEEDSSSMKTELGVVALIKEPVEKMEDETPRDIDIVCVETSDTTNEISDQSKDTVDIPTDISDVPTDLVTIPKDAIDIPVDTSDIPKDAVNTPIHTGDMPLDTNDAVKELDNTAKEIDNTQIKTYEITNLADTLEHTDDVPKETAGMQIETSYILQDTCTDGTLKLSSDGVVEKTGHTQTETDSTLKQMDDTVSGTVEPPKDTDNGLKLSDGIAKEIDDVQMETNETLIEMEASTENGGTSTSVDCTSLDTVDAQETDSNIPSNTGGMYTEIYEETVEASTKIGGEVTTDIADTLIDHTQREIDSSMLSTGGILEHKDENNTAGIANTVQWIGYTPAGVVDPHKDMNDVMKTETSDLQTETDITTDDILKQTDDTPKQTGDTQTEGGNPPQQPVDAQKDTGDTAKGIEDMWKQPGSMLSEDTLKQVHVSNQQEDVDDITEQKGDTPVDTWKQPDGTLDQSGDTLIQEVSIPVQEVDVPVQEIDIPVQEVDIPVQEVYIPVQGVEMPTQVCDTLQDIHDTPIDTGDTLKQPVGMPEQSNNASKQTDDVPMQVGSRLEQKVDTLQDIDDTPIDAGDTLKQTDSMQIEMILVIKVEDMAKETGNAQVEIQEDTESGKDDVQNLGEDESNKHSETVCQAADGLVPMEDYFKSGAQTEQDGLRYETDTTQEDSVQQAEDSVTAVDNGGEVPAFADNASLLLQGDPADMSVEESDTQAEKGVGAREDETIPQEIIGQLQREIEMEQGKVDMGESSMAKEEADTQTANDEELTGIGDDKEDMIPKEEVDMQTDSNEETIIPNEDVITEGNKEVTVPSNNVDMQNYLHTESIKECNIPKEEVDMQTENSKEIIIREDFYMHTEGIKESTIPKEEFDIRAENKTESIVPMESIHVEAEGGKEDIVSEKDTHLQTEDTKEGVIPKEDVDMQTEGIKESIVLEGNVDMETENDKEPNIPKESADMGLEDDTKDSVIPKEDVTEEYSTHKENDKRHEMSENEQEDGQDTDSIISTISDTTISLDQDDTEGMTDTQDPEWMIDDKDDPPSSCESTEETHEDSDTVVSSQITVGRDSEPNTETSTVEAIPISSSTQSEQETFPTSTSEKEATPAPVCQPDQQARKQVQQAPVSDSTSIPESCEAEGREMIKSTEELEREQALCLAKLAHDLLEQWSDLKEVYRIPKRSSPPPAKRRRSHSYHRRHSRSPSPDSDLELRMRRRQRRREGSTTDRWFRQGSYHRNSNRRLQARPRRYHWDSTDSRTQSSSSQAETYNSGDNSTTKTYNTAIQQGTIQQTTIQQGTIPQATIQQQQQGYSTYDQLVQQQQLHQQQLQQQQLQQQQQQLQQQQQQQTQQAGTTAGISLQCYPQSLITTGLVPLKPQAVNQQTQQQPQPLMQQLALPAMSQGNTAGISGVPLATGQLYGSQILFQPTQVSNFYPATPSNLPPLPPPPTVLAAAAAAAATNTLSTVEAVAQNQLLPNPIAPLQLQALPVYQPQAAVIQQQQQAGNSAIVSQQQGGGAVIQQGYLQQGILPGQLRPLDQLQQSGGMLIQQQCYVPTTAAITGLATLPLPPPPPVSSEEKGLPENWRTARDPAGKIYYYHCITKKTQWERPAANDTEGTLNMDISNSDHSGNSPETSPVQNIVTTTTASTISASSKPSEATESLHTMVIIQDTDSIPMPCDEPQDSSKPKVVPLEIAALIADAKVSRSSSPYGKGSEDGEIVDHTEMDTTSQETVTTETTSTTAAVATDVVGTPNKGSENTVLSKDAALARDHFKHNMSKLVIQCLQYHRKPGCKYGLITNSEDFKHLARKLTHGLTEKEAYHKKGYEKVEFNDSVKTKTKEYIRNYMKKFGPIYSRT